jgi:hypothetical protein
MGLMQMGGEGASERERVCEGGGPRMI